MSADKVQEAVARVNGVRTVRKFMFVRELDALIAAVREDEKARCIAAVRGVEPHEPDEHYDGRPIMVAHKMGDWVSLYDSLEAIRHA